MKNDNNITEPWTPISTWRRNTVDSYELSESFDNLTCDLLATKYIWRGHFESNFRTLTPGHLVDLYASVQEIWYRLQDFYQMAVDSNGVSDAYDNTAGDYLESLERDYLFEIELLKVISKSHEWSAGISAGVLGIIDAQFYADEFKGVHRAMLTPVVVKPWVAPSAPVMTIPEKPSVILKVLKVSDDAPRVNAGLDDIFYCKPIVIGLLVDEDVNIGDRIVVKTAGWNNKEKLLINPAFDGLAERGCPCSDMKEVMEAEYTFDLSSEIVLHEKKWYDKWLSENWLIVGYYEIEHTGMSKYKSVKGVYDSNGVARYREQDKYHGVETDFSSLYDTASSDDEYTVAYTEDDIYQLNIKKKPAVSKKKLEST